MGADRAFESGANGNAEIYLPWAGFGTKPYGADPGMPVLGKAIVPSMTAYPKHLATIREVYREHNLNFDSLSGGVQKLMFRNVFQIHGLGGMPVDFVVCYHNNSGGTIWAVRMAERKGIRVLNLRDMTIDQVWAAIQ